jgi:2-aminoethylphosphonate-pyruvate transaminase
MLVAGMKEMGFRPFLDARIQAPIIVTFHAPADARYAFKAFYDKVRDKGFILYPGKLTQLETFRVGCIGAIGPDEMRHAVNAVRDALAELGIRQIAPAAVRAA